MNDSPRLPGRSAIAALFTVAVCALLAAATLIVVIVAGGTRPEPGPTAAALVSPSPTPRSAASRAAGPPMCLIGSWHTVEDTSMVTFYSDVPPLRFTGGGRDYEFHPDGTGVERQDNVALTSSYQGRELKIVANGHREFTWTATDRAITYSSFTTTAMTWDYYDQGRLISSQTAKAHSEVDDYTCQGQALSESSATGYRSTWTRTSSMGMYG